MASYDSLTELPNRFFFMDKMGEALQRTKEEANYLFAVLFLD